MQNTPVRLPEVRLPEVRLGVVKAGAYTCQKGLVTILSTRLQRTRIEATTTFIATQRYSSASTTVFRIQVATTLAEAKTSLNSLKLDDKALGERVGSIAKF